MQEVEGQVTTLQGQQSDLNSLQSTFSSLQSAVQAISSAMTGDVSASSSNSAVVVAAAQSNTLPGTYSLQVSDIGSSTTTISNAPTTPVTDPTSAGLSSSLNYTLTVNGTPTTLTLTSNSLDSLATAINDANAGVSATIVNLGSNASPDYRLSVTSTELGADTIQLNDGTNNLLTNVQTGSDAQYTVNGNSTVLNSNSDQVTLAPGLTATLVSAAPSQTVNITVAASESNLSTALSNFATAYNAAATAVTNETGQNGGALAGESLVYSLRDMLSQITQYTGTSGSVQDLSDLGLDLDSSGNLTFNASQFDSQSAAGIQQFLGSATSGGLLEAATNALTSAADPSTGMLVTQYNTLGDEITADNTKISDDQAEVNTIQANLQAQLSAADAAIAVLQEQNTMTTSLLQTENANNIAGL
jgi:flagellar hook-associated protein 2